MKLTLSQDRDAVGGWIEGQADRQEGKRIHDDLPRLQRGEGYLWAPGRGILERTAFPAIRTFDSSRTPKRGERLAVPGMLAAVDLTAIVAALAAETPDTGNPGKDDPRYAQLERELSAARARIEILEHQNHELAARLERIAALAASSQAAPIENAAATGAAAPQIRPQPASSRRSVSPAAAPGSDSGMHPAARKLLAAAAQHAPGRFTWGQLATLAGLKPSGGISTPGARPSGMPAMSSRRMISSRSRRLGSRRPARCHPRRQLRLSGSPYGAPGSGRRRPRCCASLSRKASDLWRSRISPPPSAKSRPAATGIPGSRCCATTG